MTIEKTVNGYYKMSTMKNGYLVHQMYIGYTRKEAIAEFKAYLKTVN